MILFPACEYGSNPTPSGRQGYTRKLAEKKKARFCQLHPGRPRVIWNPRECEACRELAKMVSGEREALSQ